MEFVPKDIGDAVRSEREVWTSLEEALSGVEGIAYHRFPIYQTGGFFGYEADIVLFVRRAGVFVIECKGLRVHNLSRIEGHRWHMSDWVRDVETPVQQVRDQMFALRDWITETGELSSPLRFHHSVALPFVRRVEWEGKSLHHSSVNDAVKLADDLTPASLREWIDRICIPHPQSLSDTQWRTMTERLGHTPPASSSPTAPQFYVYEDQVPEADTIQRFIPDEKPHTYVTATTSIERRRFQEGFGGSHQIEENEEGEPEPHFTFPKMMRYIMGAELFTRSEERVLLWRAAENIAQRDEDLARQLRHDVFAWRAAIAGMEEQGYDLSTEVPDKVKDSIVHPNVLETLQALQAEYRKLQQQEGATKSVFEVKARQFLSNPGFDLTEYVVMEGFSRFTPLQELFIERCREQGHHILLLFPYRKSQARAFRAIKSAMKPYVEEENGATNQSWIQTNEFDRSHTALYHAQTNLFTESPIELPDTEQDESIEIRAYEHVNQEAADVVEKAIHFVREEGMVPGDVAIVAPHASEYASLLLEEAERRGEEKLFHVPPRKLLLTQPGRFTLTLYKVWDDEEGRLDMRPDQFMTLMASGWLRASLQKTTRAFEMVNAQVFDRCRTRDDWDMSLDRLEALCQSLDSTSRLPAAGIQPRTVSRWRRAVDQVEGICRALFDGQKYTIGQHIERLRDQLTEISERATRESELEIIRAIKEELKELEEADSIDVEAAEFGEILNSLIRQREDEEELDEDPRRISVRGPSGIDRATKKVVFMVGMHDEAMPGAPSDEWPLYRFDRDDHYDQQRYLFLAGVRAATERLHVSYPKVQEARKFQPSPFVRHIDALFEGDLDTRVSVDRRLEEPEPTARDLGPARRDDDDPYSLDELAHYKLCPHRYEMERLSEDARRYEPMWQVRFLAQGYWIEKVLDKAQDWNEPVDGDEVADRLVGLMGVVRDEVTNNFPGLRPLDWRTVEHHVQKVFRTKSWAKGDLSIVRGRDVPDVRTLHEVVEGDRSIDISVNIPHVYRVGKQYGTRHYVNHKSLLEDNQNAEWLIPGPKPDDRDRDDQAEVWDTVRRESEIDIYHRPQDGVSIFDTKYDAFQWWTWAKDTVLYYETSKGSGTSFEERARGNYHQLFGDVEQRGHIAKVIEDLESGRFPKNPGDHCGFCPLKGECLGVNP